MSLLMSTLRVIAESKSVAFVTGRGRSVSMKKNTRNRIEQISAGVLCEKLQNLDTTKLYSTNFIYLAWGLAGLLLCGLALLLLVNDGSRGGFKDAAALILMVTAVLFFVLVICWHRTVSKASKKRAEQYIFELEKDGRGLLYPLSTFVDQKLIPADSSTREVLDWAKEANVQQLMKHPVEYAHTLRTIQRSIEMRQ